MRAKLLARIVLLYLFSLLGACQSSGGKFQGENVSDGNLHTPNLGSFSLASTATGKNDQEVFSLVFSETVLPRGKLARVTLCPLTGPCKGKIAEYVTAKTLSLAWLTPGSYQLTMAWCPDTLPEGSQDCVPFQKLTLTQENLDPATLALVSNDHMLTREMVSQGLNLVTAQRQFRTALASCGGDTSLASLPVLPPSPLLYATNFAQSANPRYWHRPPSSLGLTAAESALVPVTLLVWEQRSDTSLWGSLKQKVSRHHTSILLGAENPYDLWDMENASYFSAPYRNSLRTDMQKFSQENLRIITLPPITSAEAKRVNESFRLSVGFWDEEGHEETKEKKLASFEKVKAEVGRLGITTPSFQSPEALDFFLSVEKGRAMLTDTSSTFAQLSSLLRQYQALSALYKKEIKDYNSVNWNCSNRSLNVLADIYNIPGKERYSHRFIGALDTPALVVSQAEKHLAQVEEEAARQKAEDGLIAKARQESAVVAHKQESRGDLGMGTEKSRFSSVSHATIGITMGFLTFGPLVATGVVTAASLGLTGDEACISRALTDYQKSLAFILETAGEIQAQQLNLFYGDGPI